MIAEGPDYDSTAVYLSITNIETYEERGLLGVVVDPDFDTNGFIYIYYSPYSPPYFVISRFKHIENNGG